MDGGEDTRKDAGEVYSLAIRHSIEDSTHGLKYPLLRLGSLLRLPERDREALTELGRIVIQKGDVEEVANRLRERGGVHPLAAAIASIVRYVELSSGGEDTREAMLGAVFGAYAGLESRQVGEAVQGAISGALAATTYTKLQEILESRSLSWREWSEIGTD